MGVEKDDSCEEEQRASLSPKGCTSAATSLGEAHGSARHLHPSPLSPWYHAAALVASPAHTQSPSLLALAIFDLLRNAPNNGFLIGQTFKTGP